MEQSADLKSVPFEGSIPSWATEVKKSVRVGIECLRLSSWCLKALLKALARHVSVICAMKQIMTTALSVVLHTAQCVI